MRVVYKIFSVVSRPRLNIVINAPVNKTLFSFIHFIGITDIAHISCLFDEGDWSNMCWYMYSENVNTTSNIFLFEVPIKQQLKKGLFHTESWIFGLFEKKSANEKIYYFVPLAKDSDFTFDVFQYIKKMCSINGSLPWQRLSSQL
jgi:hypothetical protein